MIYLHVYVSITSVSGASEKLKESVRFPETGVKDVSSRPCVYEVMSSARVFNALSH